VDTIDSASIAAVDPPINDQPGGALQSMRAMILAAGLGTRLHPLTQATPKPLLPLMFRPLLGSLIEQLREHGIRDIAVNVHHHAAQVRDWLGDGKRWDVHLHLSEEPVILGTAGGIKEVERFLSGAPFLVINADIVTMLDFRLLWAWHCRQQALVTMVLRPDATARRYGSVIVNPQGQVLQINGRPPLPTPPAGQETIFTGIQIVSPQVLERIPKGIFSSTTVDIYPALVEQGAVCGYVDTSYWIDIGVPARYLQAHWDLLDGHCGEAWLGRLCTDAEVYLAGGPRPTNRSSGTITPPVVLHRSVHIESGARVGPYAVLGAGCSVACRAEIHHSIALGNARIAPAAIISDSILGKDVTIPENSRLRHQVRI
jgi:mannose-1-phosphate guanylyltransferase